MIHIDILVAHKACVEAVKWAKQYETVKAAWDKCERGDWMLWIIGKLSGEPGSSKRKAVVLAACECARLALPQYEVSHPDDKRPRNAIETAELHCRGGATIAEVSSASASAYAAYAYAAYAASASAASAAYAAYAAYASAAAAAHGAAYAAYAADAASADARAKRLSECADIVRKHFPEFPMEWVQQTKTKL